MLTRFVTLRTEITRFFSRDRAMRRIGLAFLVFLGVLTEGCSYIFSEKRTVYQFEPGYGVESPQFLRSLDALGTEMVPGNAARLLENGDGIFPAILSRIAEAKLSINFEAYIFSDSVIGRQLAAALSERARFAVEDRATIDESRPDPAPLHPR